MFLSKKSKESDKRKNRIKHFVYFHSVLRGPTIACILCFFGLELLAQYNEIDSLVDLLDTNLPKKERVDIINKVALRLYSSDSISALAYFQDAVELSKAIGYSKGQATAFLNKGKVRRRDGKYSESIGDYLQAIDLVMETEHTSVLANAYQGLGISYYFQGNYENATRYGLEAAAIRKKSSTKVDIRALGSIYNNLGIIQERLGNYPGAIEYYLQSLKMKEESGNMLGVGVSYNNIGNIHYLQGAYDEAIKYYEKSIDIKERLGNKGSLAIGHNNIGGAYLDLDSLTNARFHFKKALDLNRIAKSEKGIALSLLNLGKLSLRENDFKSAEYYLEDAKNQPDLLSTYLCEINILLGRVHYLKGDLRKSSTLLKEGIDLAISLKELAKVALGASFLAECEAKRGLYQNAYEAKVLYQSINDSLRNEGISREITSMELSYRFEKEKDSIAFVELTERLKLEGELKQKTAHQNTTYVILALTILLLLIFLIFLRAIRKRNLALSALNREVQTRNQEIETQRDDLKLTNEELKRTQRQLIESEKIASIGSLAAGIGHEINNPLNFIKGSLDVLSKDIEREKSLKQKESYGMLIGYMREGVRRASGIVSSLNNLAKATKEIKRRCDIPKLIDEVLPLVESQTQNDFQIIKDYNDQGCTVLGVPASLQQAFYNILLNAAQAISEKGHIQIKVQSKENLIVAEVSDTGVGIPIEDLNKVINPFFTTKPPNQGPGLGLTTAFKIVNDHGGVLRIESHEGEGSKVTIELPIAS